MPWKWGTFFLEREQDSASVSGTVMKVGGLSCQLPPRPATTCEKLNES